MADTPRVLSMEWHDVLFAHWPVDPAVIEPTLPEGLSVDRYDGSGWLSVVAFEMRDIGPRGVPFGLSFPELNLRTYVTHEGEDPGIYFYNLDSDDRLGVPVARTLFGLPYYRARMNVSREDGWIRFRSSRSHDGVPPAAFDGRYRPVGEASGPNLGSLRTFLTERYRFYAVGKEGLVPAVDLDGDVLYSGAVSHDPWQLHDAEVEIRRNDLFEAAGFEEPAGDPVCHYGTESAVTAGLLRRL